MGTFSLFLESQLCNIYFCCVMLNARHRIGVHAIWAIYLFYTYLEELVGRLADGFEGYFAQLAFTFYGLYWRSLVMNSMEVPAKCDCEHRTPRQPVNKEKWSPLLFTMKSKGASSFFFDFVSRSLASDMNIQLEFPSCCMTWRSRICGMRFFE